MLIYIGSRRQTYLLRHMKPDARRPKWTGRTYAWLFRAWDPVRASRITLKIMGPSGEVARMDISRPLTVDNIEGVSAVPNKDGSTRFYLLSDDNFSNSQKTILLAFDWKPAK